MRKFKVILTQDNKSGPFDILYNINNDIYIAYYRPSIVDYNFNHKLIRHQYFKSENINNIEEIYMKLLRFGKTNYLDYITYLKYYGNYVCDLCDINKQGNRYKCIKRSHVRL